MVRVGNNADNRRMSIIIRNTSYYDNKLPRKMSQLDTQLPLSRFLSSHVLRFANVAVGVDNNADNHNVGMPIIIDISFRDNKLLINITN